MIGQEKLKRKLASLRKLPQTMLFLGEEGCGKHTLAKELAKARGMPFVEILPDIEADRLTEYSQSPLPALYFIGIDAMQERQQNQFLKFIEEPGRNAYVILAASSEATVLPTAYSRCMTFRFDDYTADELAKIAPKATELDCEVYRTPGRLLSADLRQTDKMQRVCMSLLTDLQHKWPAAALGYACRLNYKEDYDKFDCLAFFRMLRHVAFETYRKFDSKAGYEAYMFLEEYCKRLSYKNISKENFTAYGLLMLRERIQNGD